ncbi:hypothetical protein PAXRUDRAFT_508915 [Paxillus rubicundulus Ve08.2h10]|uniref:Uncharacterized protein n=1 Tax=Paxillus rubicundulus Ve08.2h10 TaxID=930991 RepID=A0A0D0DNT0_9AGAM|nr:hypothetical protein PAXRUDRAFT_508915 [Paxillus rubicundulus Ve08.2h10]
MTHMAANDSQKRVWIRSFLFICFNRASYPVLLSGLGYHIRERPCLQAFGIVTKELDQESVYGVIVVVGVEIVEVKVDIDEGGGLLVGSFFNIRAVTIDVHIVILLAFRHLLPCSLNVER